jgi:hypothetical protein
MFLYVSVPSLLQKKGLQATIDHIKENLKEFRKVAGY